jgi:spore cortex formation protein SpoVR/YcgB (stage V sporulation)
MRHASMIEGMGGFVNFRKWRFLQKYCRNGSEFGSGIEKKAIDIIKNDNIMVLGSQK